MCNVGTCIQRHALKFSLHVNKHFVCVVYVSISCCNIYKVTHYLKNCVIRNRVVKNLEILGRIYKWWLFNLVYNYIINELFLLSEMSSSIELSKKASNRNLFEKKNLFISFIKIYVNPESWRSGWLQEMDQITILAWFTSVLLYDE